MAEHISPQVCENMLATLKAVFLLTPDDGTQRAYAVRRIVIEAIREAAAPAPTDGGRA